MTTHPKDGAGRKGIPRTGAARNVRPAAGGEDRRRRKSAKAVVCDDCGVVFHGGKWYEGAPPLGDVERGVCPACQRVRDRDPAGRIQLTVASPALREEITNAIRNVEARERQEHPLERLMDVDVDGDTMTVTTTGMHLARCIAGGLRRRFHGKLKIHYPEGGEGPVRVEAEA